MKWRVHGIAAVAIILLPVFGAAQSAVSVIGQAAEYIASQMEKHNQQKTLAGLGAQLSEINAKLDLLSRQVQLSIKMLQDIKEHADDLEDERARKHVWATSAQIVANFDTWRRNLQEYKTIARDRMGVLQDNSRFLMANRSYLNFQMVGFAMLMEHDMFELLREPKAAREGSFKQYVDYFHSCATNEQAPFTIASLLREQRQLADDIKNAIASLPQEPLCPDYVRNTCDDDVRCRTCKFDQFTVVYRKSDGRFDFTPHKVLLNKRDCRRDISCGQDECVSQKPDRAGEDFVALSFFMMPVGQISSMEDHSQCPAQLNAKLDELAGHAEKIARLEEAQRACLKLEAQARKLFDTASALP